MLRIGFILVVTILLGSAFAQGWISDYFGPSAEQRSNQRQRLAALPSHMGETVTRRFFSLPGTEQNAIRSNLQQQLLSVNDWLTSLSTNQPQVICFGEDHEQSTRKFLAERIFPKLKLDVLMLESTPAGLANIRQAIAEKQPFVPLEDANISALITATKNKNPGIVIAGIEETQPQRSARLKQSNSGFRDDTLLKNFWAQFHPGRRHAVIFGAFHCSDNSNWLYAQLHRSAPAGLRDSLLNIRVLGEYQNESLQSMLYFLATIGMTQTDFVIPDTRKLHPRFKQWFALLAPTLRDYTTLLVFKTNDYLSR